MSVIYTEPRFQGKDARGRGYEKYIREVYCSRYVFFLIWILYIVKKKLRTTFWMIYLLLQVAAIIKVIFIMWIFQFKKYISNWILLEDWYEVFNRTRKTKWT
jgi:hypothetical protein